MQHIVGASVNELLSETAARAARYLANLNQRSVIPLQAAVDRLSQLGGPLSEEPLDRPMFLPFSMTSAPLPPWPPPVAATSDL